MSAYSTFFDELSTSGAEYNSAKKQNLSMHFQLKSNLKSAYLYNLQNRDEVGRRLDYGLRAAIRAYRQIDRI